MAAFKINLSLLRALLSSSVRAIFFRAVKWHRLFAVRPWHVVALLALSVLSGMVVDWLAIARPRAISAAGLNGWMVMIGALAFHAWVATRLFAAPNERTDATRVFAVLLAMTVVFDLFISAPYARLARYADHTESSKALTATWIFYYTMIAWWIACIVVFVRRVSAGTSAPLVSLIASLALTAHSMTDDSKLRWFEHKPRADVSDSRTPKRLMLDEIANQSRLLDAQLAALPAQRPGITDVYVITYTPYAAEDVFLRESEVVSNTMRSLFGAQDRVIRLVNHVSTAAQFPWATPEHLLRTLKRVAELADPVEDLVFIHLASHGGKDATLAAQFYPFETKELTALALRTLLDDANIGNRALSISACYSGTWLPALRAPNALVMTASDADHTSYGCGHRSPLTFFTRALYVDTLHETRSFEKAFSKARVLIQVRESEAGKDDGYSNPQIEIGDAIRPLLATLEK